MFIVHRTKIIHVHTCGCEFKGRLTPTRTSIYFTMYKYPVFIYLAVAINRNEFNAKENDMYINDRY